MRLLLSVLPFAALTAFAFAPIAYAVNHDTSVMTEAEAAHAVSQDHCRVCAADYQTRITYLMEPVDVYADWIDECDKLNKSDNDIYITYFFYILEYDKDDFYFFG